MVDIEIDPMVFFAVAIEQELQGLEVVAMLPPEIGEGVAEICHRNIAQAQETLDRLIAEDETWRPA
jgi:hypothetical protein